MCTIHDKRTHIQAKLGYGTQYNVNIDIKYRLFAYFYLRLFL